MSKNKNNLGQSLNLLSTNYDDIPEYSEILAILEWLKTKLMF